MRYFYVCVLMICFAPSVFAMSIEKELAYRVRFSGAGDIKLLLDKGADPNALNEVGLPMVSVAAGRKDDDAVSVLKTLITNGADVNRGGINNQYPIIIASRENNAEMITYLLEETEVDLTVRDLNGLLPMEIAKYYGSDDASAMITDLTNRRIEEERQRTSPERRDSLLEKLAHHYCEHQYIYYYHRSGQSGKSKKEVNAIIEEYRKNGQAQIEELYNTFRMPIEQALEMKDTVGKPLKEELDAMISNRERKRRGVGTEKDRNERCDRIAGAWVKKYRKARDNAELLSTQY